MQAAPDAEPAATFGGLIDFTDLHTGLRTLGGERLDAERIEDVIIAVHEVTTNGLRHGAPPVGSDLAVPGRVIPPSLTRVPGTTIRSPATSAPVTTRCPRTGWACGWPASDEPGHRPDARRPPPARLSTDWHGPALTGTGRHRPALGELLATPRQSGVPRSTRAPPPGSRPPALRAGGRRPRRAHGGGSRRPRWPCAAGRRR